jgi:hypothetical protein
MDKLGKFLQRGLVNASPSRFLMADVKENEMASSLPQNVTADYVRAIGSDGKSYRIPRADFASIIRSELGTILNGLTNQTTVTKVPTLNGSTLGASAVATLASVLGVEMQVYVNDGFSHGMPGYTGIFVGFNMTNERGGAIFFEAEGVGGGFFTSATVNGQIIQWHHLAFQS